MTGNYKYHEDKAMDALKEYLDGTYGQHYVGDGDVQTVDFWRSLGSLETTARDTANKYLARYGKKGGKNRKDLLKTMHYVVLMMYALDLEEQSELPLHNEITEGKLQAEMIRGGFVPSELTGQDTRGHEMQMKYDGFGHDQANWK